MEIRSGEIYGFLGPNGAGKSTTIGMLTTRVIPTSGSAIVGGVDIVRHPALAKQVIGVVPQTNTLDRAMTVEENLFFHGRYFGMSSKEAKAATDELLDHGAPGRPGRGAGAGPVGRHGPAPDGGPGDHAQAADPVPRRADRRPRPAEPPRAVGDHARSCTPIGQTILLTTHYMEEADQLCDRVAIMDHGRILALDTAAGPEARAWAPTPSCASPPPATSTGWPSTCSRRIDGATDAKVIDGTVHAVGVGRRPAAPHHRRRRGRAASR